MINARRRIGPKHFVPDNVLKVELLGDVPESELVISLNVTRESQRNHIVHPGLLCSASPVIRVALYSLCASDTLTRSFLCHDEAIRIWNSPGLSV